MLPLALDLRLGAQLEAVRTLQQEECARPRSDPVA